ncbi:sodium/proton antiporter, partial [Staphylococcus aureus]
HLEWDFVTFFIRMSPVTIPVFFAGLEVCYLVERFKLFGYGAELHELVRKVLTDYDKKNSEKRTQQEKAQLLIQALI